MPDIERLDLLLDRLELCCIFQCHYTRTSPGGNTPQGTNYTATYLPSRKLSKLDEPDMQDTTGEAGTSS